MASVHWLPVQGTGPQMWCSPALSFRLARCLKPLALIFLVQSGSQFHCAALCSRLAYASMQVWLLLDGMVLDVGRWLPEHPGGSAIIPAQSLNCDCSRFFEVSRTAHSDVSVWQHHTTIRKRYCVHVHEASCHNWLHHLGPVPDRSWSSTHLYTKACGPQLTSHSPVLLCCLGPTRLPASPLRQC